MKDDDTIPPYPAISEIEELWVTNSTAITLGFGGERLKLEAKTKH